jgi:hypothetical protein
LERLPSVSTVFWTWVRTVCWLMNQVLDGPSTVPPLAEPGKDPALRLMDLVAGEQRLLRLVE